MHGTATNGITFCSLNMCFTIGWNRKQNAFFIRLEAVSKHTTKVTTWVTIYELLIYGSNLWPLGPACVVFSICFFFMSKLLLCDNKLLKQLLHRCSKTCNWMGVTPHPHHQAVSQEFRYRIQRAICAGGKPWIPISQAFSRRFSYKCSEPTIPNENPESLSAKQSCKDSEKEAMTTESITTITVIDAPHLK